MTTLARSAMSQESNFVVCNESIVMKKEVESNENSKRGIHRNMQYYKAYQVL